MTSEASAKRICIRSTGGQEHLSAIVPVAVEGTAEPESIVDGSSSGLSGGGGNEDDMQNKIILNSLLMLEGSSSSESDDEENIILNVLRNDYFPMLNDFWFLSERYQRNSVKNFVTKMVPTYTEMEFRRQFRISKSLFECLSERLLEWDHFKALQPGKRLSEKVHMLVFLWFAGHEACSIRDLSDRFNLSLSTVSVIIGRISLFLSSLSPDFIKWPNEQQKQESSQFFDSKCMFSKAIGCIDGTHIRIDPPRTGKDDYIDRKGIISVCMQGICNEKKKFLNVFVGYPGSCHDSWVLKNSPIYTKLPSYCGDYYILGDSAYPCNEHMVTPYRDNGHLTRSQKLFNIKLSSGRVAIEHTFGILKQRFRQLYYCKLRGMKKLCHFIRACCVLHNIANEEDLNFIEEDIPEVSNAEQNQRELMRGNSLRDEICRNIQDRLNEYVR